MNIQAQQLDFIRRIDRDDRTIMGYQSALECSGGLMWWNEKYPNIEVWLTPYWNNNHEVPFMVTYEGKEVFNVAIDDWDGTLDGYYKLVSICLKLVNVLYNDVQYNDEHQCEDCYNWEGKHTTYPYSEETSEVITPVVLCDECYQKRLMEV